MGPDPIAEVERIDGVKDIVADHRLADEQLHVVRTIANGDEEQLALVALQHDATAYRYGIGGLVACSQLAILGANLAKAVCAIKAVGVRVGASSAQVFDFGQAALSVCFEIGAFGFWRSSLWCSRLVAHAMMTSTSPAPTLSPACTLIALTVPALSACN